LLVYNVRVSALLLRVDVFVKGDHLIGHSVEVTSEGATIRGDVRAEAGDRVLVRLSFPGAGVLLEVEGHVASRRAGRGSRTGEVTVAFVFRSDAEAARLRELLDPNAEATAPATGDAPPPCRVLLVDDNAMVREMFLFAARRAAASSGAQVVVDVASGAGVARGLLAEQNYDVLIIDYYLPDALGTDLLAGARQDPRLALVPFVGLSGGGTKAREAFLSAGADMFLDKPIAPRDVIHTLKTVAALRRAA
jgi:CheY-like chemotaxis protein